MTRSGYFLSYNFLDTGRVITTVEILPGLVPMRLLPKVHLGLSSLNVASMPFMQMVKSIASPA